MKFTHDLVLPAAVLLALAILFVQPVAAAAPTVTFLESGTDATQDLSFFASTVTVNGTMASSAAQAHTGGRSLAATVTVTGGEAQAGTPEGVVSDAGAAVSAWVSFSTARPATATGFLKASVSGGASANAVIGVGLNPNGTLVVAGRGATAVNGSTVVSANTWYRVSFAYVITSPTSYTVKLYVNGNLDATAHAGTLSATGTSNVTVGIWGSSAVASLGSPAAMTIVYDDLYVDNRADASDPGDIRVTAKRPVANGTVNQFTTRIGTGGSGYGTGHAPQANERPLSTANGWSISTTTKATEAYTIEGRAVGDVDLTNATILDALGWIEASEASTSNSPVTHILVNGTATAKTLTTAAALYTQFARSSIYPSGSGADIGMDGQYTTTPHLFSLAEAGLVLAYVPSSGGDTTPPTVPATVTATALSSSQIQVNWSASSDPGGAVAGYDVYRSDLGTTPVATTTATTYTNGGLTANTSYSYTVAAFDTSGNVSAPSSPAASATTGAAADTTPPTVPANVTATALSSSQITVSWSASSDPGSGVGGYDVYRSDLGTTPVTTTTSTSFTNAGLTPSTSYAYTVAAFDTVGNVSAPSTPAAQATTLASGPPSTSTATFIEPGTDATQDLSLFGPAQAGNGSLASDGTVAHTGPRALNATVTVAGGFANLTTPSGIALDAGTRVSVWFRFSSVLPATSSNFLDAQNLGSSQSVLGVGLNTNGTLRLAGRGATAKNGTTVLAANTWYRLTLSYTIAAATNWTAKVFLNGALELTTSNSDGTLTATGTSGLQLGLSTPGISDWASAGHPSAMSVWYDDLYVDSGTTLDDPGDVRVAAKRPVANGTVNQFTTKIGSGGSGYGSGHAPQVNERPLNTANGWSISTTTKATEAYTIEGRAAGDVDLSGATILDYMGWIEATEASTSNSPVTHILVNGTATAKTLTTSYAPYTQFARSSIYPSGGGADIGMDGQYTTTAHLFSLTESGIVFAYTPGVDTQPPTVPANVTATALSSSQITVSWSASSDPGGAVAGYDVYRGDLGTTPVTTTTATTFTNTGLTPSTSYSYTVAAFDTGGNVSAPSSPPASATTSTPDTVPPTVPANVTATAVSSSQITVSWSASSDPGSGVGGYYVYRSDLGTTPVTTTTSTSFTNGGLTPSTSYSYTVAAFDTVGNVSAPSAPPAQATTLAGAGPGPSVALSSNGRYLVDQNGQPFFINGDAAWSLVAQLSNADADLYLTNRQQKGYNVLLMRLIEHLFSDHAPADFNGDQPFLTPGNFTTPNEAYFAHADWVISEAAARGQVVMLDPLYLGYDCGSQGWCAEVKNSSTATMQSWGTYVGTRYKNVPNIIWVVGGDADPVANNVTSQVQAFATALTQADPGHLVTAHNARGQAAVDPWPNATWLTLNDVYTDNLTYVSAATQATRVPFKPYFLIETYYENEHGSTPQSVRAEAYWDILSGGLAGHIFGNCPVWGFNDTALESNAFCAGSLQWQTQLESQGSVTVALVGKLFTSRAFQLLAPDLNHTVLTAGYQSGTSYATAARASDGSTVIAYLPVGQAVTIDMTKVAGGTATAWWFNPRTGAAAAIGTFATTGTKVFTPSDGNDWVLVLDNASLSLPPPGN